MRLILAALALGSLPLQPALGLDVQASWPDQPDVGTLVALSLARDGRVLALHSQPVDSAATDAVLPIGPVPRQTAQVQIGLVRDGRLVAQSPRVPTSTAETSVTLDLSAVLALGFAEDMLCPDLRLANLRQVQDRLTLTLPGQVLDFAALPDDPDRWSTRDGRVLTRDDAGIVVQDATGADAMHCAAVPFRPILPLAASGLGDDWQVTLDAAEIRVLWPDADAARDAVAATGFRARLDTDTGALVFRADDLALTLIDAPCRRPGAQVPQPYQASLTGAAVGVNAGCAGDPLVALRDTLWQVDRLFGVQIRPDQPEFAPLTLEVEGTQISGRAACNRYVGAIDTPDGRLRISDLGTTRLGCPAALQSQELRFLDALEAATGFEVTANGTLVLRAGHVPVLSARQGQP